MPQWPSSLRARLTLSYTLLLGLPLIAFAVACYVVTARALDRRTDEFIGDALTAFSRELAAERRATLSVVEAIHTTVEEVRFRELQIAVLDTMGRIIAMSDAAEDADAGRRLPPPAAEKRMLDAVRAQQLTAPLSITQRVANDAFRVISRPIVVEGQPFALTATYSLNDTEQVLARIREMFLVAVPLLLLSATMGGYVLATRSLAPVASMAAQAADITASNMHQRLPVGGGDELVGLARVVNGLLDRLEHSFAQQRRFVADASHELRTPTAVVRTEADITLAREHRTEEEYRASVTIIRDAAGRLTRIVDDLFLLARADSGHLVMRREPLYLEELLHDATQTVRSVAAQREVHVEVGQVVEAPIEGDADLLGRVLLNLLDNAIKYSPRGAAVSVALQRSGERYNISVMDTGPGIPTDAHERVFERFYRVDNARTRSETASTSGAGLGLSIARRIAEMHGGDVTVVESRAGKTEMRLSLPA